MKVLIVHNRYQQAGGEDVAVAGEHALLEAEGWDARLWCVSNDAIAGPWEKIAAAARAPYSRPARDRLAQVLAEFAPAVLHVHNFFPLLSPSVYDAGRAAGAAVVQTLHNYRPICAGALLARGGRPCEDCLGASPYRAALHGCYRGSRLGSIAVARMVDLHRRRGTWSHSVDRYIALSDFAKRKFVVAGFPSDRIAVKPNFAPDRRAAASDNRAGALYVGRLSPEKGIGTLLQASTGLAVPLRIIGEGPLLGAVTQAAGTNLMALGRRPPAEVAADMAKAACLVLPSQVYENFPMVIAEAFCQSLPVIASRIGALAEIVTEGVTGLLFRPGDAADLASKMRWAADHPQAMRVMGCNARTAYETRYSPSVNLAQLTEIYETALAQSRRAPPFRRN